MSVNSRLSAALADRYRIEREFGAGGMANVYLASDLKHDRHVAINPRNCNVRVNAAPLLLDRGLPQDVLAEMDAAERLGAPIQKTVQLRVLAHIALGDSASARAAVRAAAARLGSDAASSFWLADRETAIATLDRASQSFHCQMPDRDAYLPSALWAPVRSDPRFVRAVNHLVPR